jgi:hypothetical protein
VRRTRLRRRLLLYSAPVAVVALVVALKLISMVVAGDAAVDDYRQRNPDGLAADVSVLRLGNVVEAAKAPFAAGTLAVLDGRLADADAEFGDALGRMTADDSCPARVNLELVRETQGDLATRDGQPAVARERYLSAKAMIDDAPPGCFAGNDDPDPERRTVRTDAAARLAAKLEFIDSVPPPIPQAPPPDAPPPPPPPAAGGAPESSPEPDAPRRLDPRDGDPLDRLKQVLRDSAEAAQNGG